MKFIRNDNSLYNGISQQAVELRLPNQVTDATNCKLSVSYGLEKRPPAEVISRRVGQTNFSLNTLVHKIDRDQYEQYLMAWGETASISKVFDLEGTEYPIVYTGDTQGYVYTVNPTTVTFTPSTHLKLTTVLDNTILVNKNAVTGMDASTKAPTLLNDVYVWIESGVIQVKRVLDIDGIHTVTALKGTDNDTEVIVDEFVSAIGALANLTATKISKSVFLIQHTDSTPVKVIATDTYGDSTMKVSYSTGTEFEQLPPKALDDAVVKIESSVATELTYYLKFDEDADAWFETAGSDEAVSISNKTMPKTVIRRQDDGAGTATGTPNQIYFSVEEITWGDKVSGDVENAPNPSFLDKTINDVFFYKNRLGFLSGENVILSTIDDLFNFFPKTIKEVLDDDPVDISVSSNTAITLNQVATFPDSLIIFGSNKQFTMNSGGKAFTALNIQVEPTTSYNSNIEADPVPIGSSLFFNAPVGRFSSLREYAVTPDTLVSDAVDVTGHVPRLLPANIKQIIADPNLEYIFLIDKNEAVEDCRNTLWVYKFFWQGNEKIQSSWTKWDLWCNPIGGGVFDGNLVLLCNSPTGGDVLITMNLEAEPVEFLRDGTDIPYKVTQPLLDNMQDAPLSEITFTEEGLTLKVDAFSYTIYGDACLPSVIIDKWTGEEYAFDTKYTTDDGYYLEFIGTSTGTGVREFTYDPRILGTYTTGNDEIYEGV